MSDQDKDTLEQDENTEFLPGEEEFDEEPEGEELKSRAAEEPKGGRRFGLRRNAEEEEHPLGSVKATHERVHVDDRASALFALIAAFGLIAILITPLIVSALPAGPAPTLAPLNNLQTYAPPPTEPPATPTPTVAPTASVSPSGS